MDEIYKGISEEELVAAQEKLVEYSGIDSDKFKSYPVEFTFGRSDWQPEYEDNMQHAESSWCCGSSNNLNTHVRSKTEYIWTYELGDDSKPHLVIVHGYGGSGMVFYKMYQYLEKHFHVYFLDLLGQGRSSRSDFKCKTNIQCIRYFVESIEKWRVKMRLENMHLMGHSFGAYIVAKYALFYPENVKKLMFLSPFASELPPEDIDEAIEEKAERLNLNWFTSKLMKLALFLWKNDWGPYDGVKFSGKVIGGFFIKKVMQRRLKKLDKEEFDDFYKYLHQIAMRKDCSEKAFPLMFEDIFWSKTPIFNNIKFYKENDIDISFYYGTDDVMDSFFQGKHVSEQLQDEEVNVYMILNSDHHVYFDEPEQTTSLILDDFAHSGIIV